MDPTATALVLAQEDGGKGPPQKPFNPFESLLFPLVLGFLFIYFFLIRPQRREQDAKRQLLEGLKKNDRVVTTGGMFGTVVNIKGDEVTLRVDDQAKVKIRLLKSAISRVVTEDDSAEEANKS